MVDIFGILLYFFNCIVQLPGVARMSVFLKDPTILMIPNGVEITSTLSTLPRRPLMQNINAKRLKDGKRFEQNHFVDKAVSYFRKTEKFEELM
jgi:hypothetical protein